MKYCSECGSEYEDSVTTCADDGSTDLVTADVLKSRGIPTATERDTRRFIRAGVAEDPLSAQRFTQVLEEESIPVFARPRRAGSADMLSVPSNAPWWEILVPEENLDKATALLQEARREIDAGADENARAAEAEAMEAEKPQ